jgi:pyruvate/2-oxoglutarate dehydrogenase complex dihydrolipoamide dehydrogenase (E3) component
MATACHHDGRVESFDLVVLGAGTAGLGAARSAAQAGRSVLLLDSGPPGGDCTWSGCVPSKSLIEVARNAHAARSLGADPAIDMRSVHDRVHAIISDIAEDESPARLAREGVSFRRQLGRFTSDRVVELEDGTQVTGAQHVIATGAGPLIPPIDGLGEVAHLTNRTVFDLTEVPSHLLVLGGGPIACELAQAWRRLGAQVTVFEALDRILTKDEPEVSTVLQKVFAEEGITVHTGSTVTRVSAGPTLHLQDGRSFSGSHLLVAVGRRPNTDGLEASGVTVDPKTRRVVVDDRLRTSVSHIWAAGDCATPLQLTHVADEQGRLAAANAFARRAKRFDDRVIPWITFTSPEVGRVGLSEAEAFTRYGSRAVVTHVPMGSQDRARCCAETTGFVKLIAAPTTLPGRVTKYLDRIVGLTVVAPPAGEMIHTGVLAMAAGVPAYRLAKAVHAYPSWSLALRYAAAALFVATERGTRRPAQAPPG